jgi:hypothetical protein
LPKHRRLPRLQRPASRCGRDVPDESAVGYCGWRARSGDAARLRGTARTPWRSRRGHDPIEMTSPFVSTIVTQRSAMMPAAAPSSIEMTSARTEGIHRDCSPALDGASSRRRAAWTRSRSDASGRRAALARPPPSRPAGMPRTKLTRATIRKFRTNAGDGSNTVFKGGSEPTPRSPPT